MGKLLFLVCSLLPLLVHQQVSASTCLDNSTQCTAESTCCELISGQFGCCPIPNAVCCSDRQHCCPQKFTCIHDVCTKGISNTITTEDVLCPDGQHQCPDDMTCCKSSSSDSNYACCPLPDAVCCSDGQHCCPGGTICDVAQGGCIPTTITSASLSLTPAIERLDDVPCSASFSCPSGDTCCHVPSGSWGCCPLTDAVCCDDHVHCCPHGSQCGPSGCQGGTLDEVNLFYLQRPAAQKVAEPVNPIVCPGGQYQCPDQTTCCQLSSGSAWGCCPAPNAVCCDDHVHCCPQGTRCGPSGCLGLTTDTSVNPFQLQSSAKVAEPVNPIVCPGGQYQCPDQTTCCQLSSGAWGCCPAPNAVCCDDHIHCCPQGTRCGPSGCLGLTTDTSVNPFQLQSSAKVAEPVNPIVCPGGQYQCPDQTTCCQLSSGAWGCCPAPNAVCCDDHVHCCPQGTRCGPSGCLQGLTDTVNPFQLQSSAKVAEPVNPIVCPGGQYQCPDETTCCQLSSGAWGCCPASNAVCCDDHVHCCPQGTRCGPSGCLGLMTTETVIPFQLQSSAKVAEPINPVVCPGGQYECPDQSTCCKLPSGSWGCCPLPDAVCCDDRIHCCPTGYTCTSGVCSRANASSLPWMRKRKAKPIFQSLFENV